MLPVRHPALPSWLGTSLRIGLALARCPASLRSLGRALPKASASSRAKRKKKLSGASISGPSPSYVLRHRVADRPARSKARPTSEIKMCCASFSSERPRFPGFDPGPPEPNCGHEVRNELFAGFARQHRPVRQNRLAQPDEIMVIDFIAILGLDDRVVGKPSFTGHFFARSLTCYSQLP